MTCLCSPKVCLFSLMMLIHNLLFRHLLATDTCFHLYIFLLVYSHCWIPVQISMWYWFPVFVNKASPKNLVSFSLIFCSSLTSQTFTIILKGHKWVFKHNCAHIYFTVYFCSKMLAKQYWHLSTQGKFVFVLYVGKL